MGEGRKTMAAPKTTLLRRLLRVLGALILLFVVAAGVVWAAFRDDILKKVIATAEAQLAEDGLYTRFGAHHLTWRGSVELDGVELFADEEKSERIAEIGELFIRIPLGDLVSGNSRMVVSSTDSELSVMAESGELRLEDLSFRFVVDAEKLSISRFESRFQGLGVTVDGVVRRDKRAAEEREMVTIPDLSPVVKAATWLEFSGGDPTVSLTVSPRATTDEGHRLEAAFRGSDFRWKSMSFDEATFDICPDKEAVELRSMSLAGYGGELSGSLRVDYGNRRLVLRQVQSTMDPFRLIEALPVSEKVRLSMKQFRSLGTTTIHGDELSFDLANFSRSAGEVILSTKSGVGVTSAVGEVVLTDLSAKVTLEGRSLTVASERFGLFGGSGSGRCRMPLSGAFQYQATVNASGVSAAKVDKALALAGDLTGTVKLNYSGKGGSGPRSHSGKGRVEMSDGDFYSLPAFGGLRSFLQSQSKVFGQDVAGDLGMDFTLSGGVVRSSNLVVEGDTSKIEMKGEMDHVGKTVDIHLTIKLKGVMGVVTHVVSKVLSVHGVGSIGSIRWNLAPISGFDGSTLETVGDAATTVVDETGSAVKDVGKAVGDGVKGAFDTIFGRKKDEE